MPKPTLAHQLDDETRETARGDARSLAPATARRDTAAPAFEPAALATLAKALGHPARIKIIETLRRRRTCIGCDIVEEIGLAASTTSEHLRILKDAGLVIGEIERPRVCYSLNPSALSPLTAFLSLVADTPPARLETGGDRDDNDTNDTGAARALGGGHGER